MTKCIVLGSQDEPQPKKKPIEFIYYSVGDKNYFDNKWEEVDNIRHSPKSWQYVKLVQKNWRGQGLDLMIAHDNEQPENGFIVLGHWNDGVVE